MSNPPLKATIIPVTPLQQNCTLLWCTETMLGAFFDPGGDLERLKAAAGEAGVTIEKILVTHGHIDHCGQAGILAEELGVPIEGPHEEDLFWITRLQEDGERYGINGKPFKSDRYLVDGDRVTVGKLTFDVRHCPGHTPGLWPMGDETHFVPGHGPMSTFGHERATNPFVADRVLARS
jgi:hydroxyacylglutathione hydrolase